MLCTELAHSLIHLLSSLADFNVSILKNLFIFSDFGFQWSFLNGILFQMHVNCGIVLRTLKLHVPRNALLIYTYSPIPLAIFCIREAVYFGFCLFVRGFSSHLRIFHSHREVWSSRWLIDWIVFNAVSAIFQPIAAGSRWRMGRYLNQLQTKCAILVEFLVS